MSLKERIEATQMKKCREADCNPLPCDECDTECEVVNCPKLIEWMSEENMRNMILKARKG